MRINLGMQQANLLVRFQGKSAPKLAPNEHTTP